MRSLGQADVTLLSRFLLWRVAQSAPADPHTSDIDQRLRGAGAAFRRRTRPLSVDELSDAVTRLRASS